MRIGVYGGSFHPPHVGHAMVAAWLLWTERVEEVWMVPSFSHPFDKPLAPFAKRIGWCTALAASVDARVKVSEIERELPTPSYTVSMLQELARRHPEHIFHLVIGADILPTTAQWRAWEVIARDFAPIVVGRAGYQNPPDTPVFPDVSSTEVRLRLREGLTVDHLVPAAVLRMLRAADPLWGG
jgi:nicotinate-nucleotide adenylyltransferase